MAADNERFVSVARMKYFAKNLPWQRMRKAMGLGDTLGALPVENGGTGVDNLGDLGLLVDQAKAASSANKIIIRGTYTMTPSSSASAGGTQLAPTIVQDPYKLFSAGGSGGFPVTSRTILGTQTIEVEVNTTQKWATTASSTTGFYHNIYSGYEIGSEIKQATFTDRYYFANSDDTSWNVVGTKKSTVPSPGIYVFPASNTSGIYLLYNAAGVFSNVTSGRSVVTITISILPYIY